MWKGFDIQHPLDTPTSWNVIWNTWHENVQSAWLLAVGQFCQDPRRWIVAVFVTSVADRPNPVPPHSARNINIANVSGWVGFAQCTPQKGRGILGQLVRLFANDPSPSPNRGSRVGPSIGVPASQTLREAAMARRALTGVAGFEPPTWREMAAGTRAPERDPEDFEPGWVRGWQHEASSREMGLKCRCGHFLDVFRPGKCHCPRVPRGGETRHHERSGQRSGTRLEVAVDGLPLYGGTQLAVDATIVSPRERDCNQGRC